MQTHNIRMYKHKCECVCIYRERVPGGDIGFGREDSESGALVVRSDLVISELLDEFGPSYHFSQSHTGRRDMSPLRTQNGINTQKILQIIQARSLVDKYIIRNQSSSRISGYRFERKQWKERDYAFREIVWCAQWVRKIKVTDEPLIRVPRPKSGESDLPMFTLLPGIFIGMYYMIYNFIKYNKYTIYIIYLIKICKNHK